VYRRGIARPVSDDLLGTIGAQVLDSYHSCDLAPRFRSYFCSEGVISAPLARARSNCGTPLSPTAKFCPAQLGDSIDDRMGFVPGAGGGDVMAGSPSSPCLPGKHADSR
jgi:hypothetical protein